MNESARVGKISKNLITQSSFKVSNNYKFNVINSKVDFNTVF